MWDPEGIVYVIKQGVTAIVGGLVVLGVPAAIRAWAKRNGKNGHSPSAASQQLLQRDIEWRQDIDATLEKFNRALFEPEGALRMGDHNVRKDVTAVISQMATATGDQYRDLRHEVKVLSAEVGKLTVELAKHGNCCEHCPGQE